MVPEGSILSSKLWRFEQIQQTTSWQYPSNSPSPPPKDNRTWHFTQNVSFEAICMKCQIPPPKNVVCWKHYPARQALTYHINLSYRVINYIIFIFHLIYLIWGIQRNRPFQTFPLRIWIIIPPQRSTRGQLFPQNSNTSWGLEMFNINLQSIHVVFSLWFQWMSIIFQLYSCYFGPSGYGILLY